jgi:uncharacterized damage-inducible protein DinB
MFTREGLLRYHEMAHEGLEKLLAHVQSLPQDKFRQELDGFGMPSVRAQLVHILDVEYSWVLLIQGKGDTPYDWWHESDLQTPAELADHRRWVEQQTREWLTTETDASLNSPRDVTEGGRTHAGIPAEMLLHLMTHAYHHKGQAAAMCRLLGHPAPMTDMIWIGFQREQAEMEEKERQQESENRD